jgi:hypothetical protein
MTQKELIGVFKREAARQGVHLTQSASLSNVDSPSEPRPNPFPSVDSHMTQTELCLTHSDYRMSQSTQFSVTNSNVCHYVLWLSVTYIIN